MIGKVLISLVIVTVGAAAIGMIAPGETRVERSIVIDAPQERVYALAADFHNWQAWSPFAAASGANVAGEGIGQTLRWSGANAPLRSGEQTLAGLSPQERVDTILRFRPLRTGEASLTFSAAEGGVRAVWSFKAKTRHGVDLWMKPFAAYEALILRREIGDTYAQSLENLKRVAESGAAATHANRARL